MRGWRSKEVGRFLVPQHGDALTVRLEFNLDGKNLSGGFPGLSGSVTSPSTRDKFRRLVIRGLAKVSSPPKNVNPWLRFWIYSQTFMSRSAPAFGVQSKIASSAYLWRGGENDLIMTVTIFLTLHRRLVCRRTGFSVAYRSQVLPCCATWTSLGLLMCRTWRRMVGLRTW